MYGFKNLALNKTGRKQTETAKMKFLCRVSGHSHYHNEYSNTIPTQLGIFNYKNTRSNCMNIYWCNAVGQPEELCVIKLQGVETLGDPEEDDGAFVLRRSGTDAHHAAADDDDDIPLKHSKIFFI
jgi:hypothetical protein